MQDTYEECLKTPNCTQYINGTSAMLNVVYNTIQLREDITDAEKYDQTDELYTRVKKFQNEDPSELYLLIFDFFTSTKTVKHSPSEADYLHYSQVVWDPYKNAYRTTLKNLTYTSYENGER